MSEDETRLTAQEWNKQFSEGGWVDSLPEELRDNPGMDKFKGTPHSNVVNSYFQLEKAFRETDKVPKPRVSYKKNEWQEWNKKYNEGYPEAPDKYDTDMSDIPEDTPEEVRAIFTRDAELLKQVAHENGITELQARELWRALKMRGMEAYKAQQESMDKMKTADKQALDKEWGEAKEDKLRMARGVLQKFASKDLLETMSNRHVGKDFWIMLANIGENFKEGTIDIEERPSGAMTPKDIRQKLSEIRSKPAYMNRKDPMHKDLFMEAIDLEGKLAQLG